MSATSQSSPTSSPPATSRRKHCRRRKIAPVYSRYGDTSSQESFRERASFVESDNADNHGVSDFVSKVNPSIQSVAHSSSPTSYMNVASLPIFHGTPDECPIKHLNRFLKVCRANNASSTKMMMNIFPVTLEDEADLWYDLNIDPYPSLTWEQIKLSFLQAYHRIDIGEQLRSELFMLKQGNNESIRSYFLRLQWILKRWPDHGLENYMLKGIFIDGLKQEFQDWIIPQNPSTLNDALSLAFSYEQVQIIRGTREKEMIKCGFCEGLHEEQVCEIKEEMREFWLRNKDKKLIVSTINSNGHEAERTAEKKALVGQEEERLGCSKSLCQCSKHQCWKKKLERNNSLLFGKPNAD